MGRSEEAEEKKEERITEEPQMTSGVLRWFTHTPTDLLEAHRELYGDIIENYFRESRI